MVAFARPEIEQECKAESEIPDSLIDRERVEAVIDFMNANLHRNVALADLAGVVNLSPSHFSRLFKSDMGAPPSGSVEPLLSHVSIRLSILIGELAAPGAGVGADAFRVRWTGQVEVPETANYTFSVRTDDGVKLWVNNQVLIDKWFVQSGTSWTNTIVLIDGQKYDIRMEMYDWNGGAEAHLWWQRPSQSAREIIPRSRLYPYNPAAQPLFEGRLDAIDCTTLTGWALNRRQPNTVISVKIYADSNPTALATLTANQYRADLVDYSCDNALHGFSWTVPTSLKDGLAHTITVKYADNTNILLWGTPAILTCSPGLTRPVS